MSILCTNDKKVVRYYLKILEIPWGIFHVSCIILEKHVKNTRKHVK